MAHVENQDVITKTLPEGMLPIFDLFAKKQCQLKGIRKGSKEYQEAYDTYLFTFQHESYVNSLSTGEVGKDLSLGILARNPSSPKVESEYFNLSTELFGKDGFFSENYSDEYMVEVYERRLRSIVASLSNLILETKYSLRIKRPKSDDVSDDNVSSFEHKPDGKDRLTTVKNQYMRLYYVSRIINKIKPLFLSEQVSIDKLLTEVFGDEFNQYPEPSKYDILIKKSSRQNFMKNFLNSVKKVFDVIQNPMRRPMKKNPVSLHTRIFCDQIGIYLNSSVYDFCKGKEEKQIVPRKDYISGIDPDKFKLNEQDAKKSCIFGSFINVKIENDEKIYYEDHFLICGAERIKRDLENGFPTTDAFILSVDETYSCFVSTSKTVEKINELKRNYKTFKDKRLTTSR